jgi:hypothetical protein
LGSWKGQFHFLDFFGGVSWLIRVATFIAIVAKIAHSSPASCSKSTMRSDPSSAASRSLARNLAGFLRLSKRQPDLVQEIRRARGIVSFAQIVRDRIRSAHQLSPDSFAGDVRESQRTGEQHAGTELQRASLQREGSLPRLGGSFHAASCCNERPPISGLFFGTAFLTQQFLNRLVDRHAAITETVPDH